MDDLFSTTFVPPTVVLMLCSYYRVAPMMMTDAQTDRDTFHNRLGDAFVLKKSVRVRERRRKETRKGSY